MIYQLQHLRIFSKKVFANVTPRRDRILLEFSVDGFLHALDEQSARVLCQQLIPVRSPDYLDDIPPRPTEKSFEFLDNFSVAAHRPVKPLQIAVDDPDEVVEIF